jgi:hypothetical protein
MMYVSGETAEASSETTGMIEEIVRQQVIEMVCHISPRFNDHARTAFRRGLKLSGRPFSFTNVF